VNTGERWRTNTRSKPVFFTALASPAVRVEVGGVDGALVHDILAVVAQEEPVPVV